MVHGFSFNKKDTLFCIVALILSFLTVLIFIWFLDYMDVVIAQYRFFTGGFYKLLGIACIGWFFAALKEEVLARGYFMANLSRLSIPNAIFISALLFMALHFVMGDLDPYRAASWFTGGIVYAYIYVKSGSLTVSTMVHAAHNLVNDLVIHGSEGALVLLSSKVTTADKLIYELILGALLILLTYIFYGKNDTLNGLSTMTFEANSGDIVLIGVSDSYNLDFKATSGDGIINVPGFLFEEKSEHRILGRTGNGELSIMVRTTSGDLKLQ